MCSGMPGFDYNYSHLWGPLFLTLRVLVISERKKERKEGINMCLVIFSHCNFRTYITKGMLLLGLLVHLRSCNVSFSS